MTIERVNETLWLSEDMFLNRIVTEVDAHFPNEAGGILLGYVDGPDRVVTAVIGAGPNAEHKPYRMLPDNEYQQRIMAERFERSGGREQFLGEWHSHPASAPVMSWVDRRTLHRVSTQGRNLLALPVMMIAGVDAESDGRPLRVYRKRNSSKVCLWPFERMYAELQIRFYDSQLLRLSW